MVSMMSLETQNSAGGKQRGHHPRDQPQHDDRASGLPHKTQYSGNIVEELRLAPAIRSGTQVLRS